MITRVYSVIPCISLGLSHYSYGFCTWCRHGNLAELKASELGQLKCDLLGLGRTCGCLGYIHIYIYTRPRLQHHLHVVPGLFEKTKKTKQHWKNRRNHFPRVLGTEGASQESQNIVFFFVSPVFLVFSSFFLVFSLGPSSKSHFFSRFYGGISQCFFGFILGAFSKESFFFAFLLCFSGFSNFLLVFVFSFFLFSSRGH